MSLIALQIEVDELDALCAPSTKAFDATHLNRQIERLEQTVIKLQRRKSALSEHARHTPALDDEDRDAIDRKVRNVQTKIARLRDVVADNTVRSQPPGARAGVPAELRRALRRLLIALRDETPHDTATISSTQQRIGSLVRARRDRLTDVARRLADARNYFADAATRAGEVVVDVGTRSLGGAAASVALRRTSQRISMAAMVLEEIERDFRGMADDWPELNALLMHDAWRGPPSDAMLQRCDRAIRSFDTDEMEPGQAVLGEFVSTAKASALWIEELRLAVINAPPPSNQSIRRTR